MYENLKQQVNSEFLPDLTNPYYFMRKGIYEGVERNAHFLTGRILDFGCGSKPYKSLFNFSEYIGLDFDNPGHPHDNEEIDIYYDGKRIPLEDNSIDAVLCSEVFEHVFNLPHILNELNRVMKPGAHILITCPFVWKEHEEPFDYARYTLFALDELLTKHNFEKVVLEKGGNFAVAVAQLFNLFLFDKLHGKAHKYALTKKIFYNLFIPALNVCGILFGKLFRNYNKLYLSNIVVFKKTMNIDSFNSSSI